MRVLWLVSMTLPQAAAACGLPGASDVSGGWLTGQLTALRAQGEPDITVCSIDTRADLPTEGEAEGIHYRTVPNAGHFAALLAACKPDLVHIWGTEYAAAAAMQQAAAAARLPVLVGIQGVMRHCAVHLCDGVPESYLRSTAMQRAIDRVVPGALLDKSQRQFNTLAQSEAAVLGAARHVTGRTGFDRAAVQALAPGARYYPCNETLRPEFYAAAPWQPHARGDAPVLFLPQGNYPLKNLHTALRAMPAILARYPGAVLRVAGWPPLEKGPLLRPVIEWMFPYQRYCKTLVRELGLQGHLEYTGPLSAAQFCAALQDADLFMLCSTSENSPNSLGEAMLLGMPCVASRVGGIPDLLAHEATGLLYGDPLDADALAAAVLALLDDPARAQALGQAARTVAQTRHAPAANAAALADIYAAVAAPVQEGRT